MVSLLELHKLMYFLQEAGEPLRLKYVKAPYGPFAENLGHVLKAVEGHIVSGYADGGDAPEKPLQLVPGAREDADRFLAEQGATRKRLDRVSALVEGFESPTGLELLSTVHWVMRHEAPGSPADLTARVHAWNSRKQAFTPRQIELAARRLAGQGWTDRPAKEP